MLILDLDPLRSPTEVPLALLAWLQRPTSLGLTNAPTPALWLIQLGTLLQHFPQSLVLRPILPHADPYFPGYLGQDNYVSCDPPDHSGNSVYDEPLAQF